MRFWASAFFSMASASARPLARMPSASCSMAKRRASASAFRASACWRASYFLGFCLPLAADELGFCVPSPLCTSWRRPACGFLHPAPAPAGRFPSRPAPPLSPGGRCLRWPGSPRWFSAGSPVGWVSGVGLGLLGVGHDLHLGLLDRQLGVLLGNFFLGLHFDGVGLFLGLGGGNGNVPLGVGLGDLGVFADLLHIVDTHVFNGTGAVPEILDVEVDHFDAQFFHVGYYVFRDFLGHALAVLDHFP